MAPSSNDSPPRRKRRWLRVLGMLAFLLIALVALLPTLISLGLGNGLIRNAVAANINGDVQINRIGVGWFTGQSIDGVRITDAAGKEAANVSVSLDNSLLSLALGRAKPMRITVSGSIVGEIREDGSLSFADLVKTAAAKPAGAPKPPPASRPAASPTASIPPVQVDFAGLSIAMDDRRTQQAVKLSDLTGSLAYLDATQPITIDLHGKTATTLAGRTESGAIDITGQADGLFAPDGAITLRGAATKLEVKASGVPLPVGDFAAGKPATLQALTLGLISDDLTDRIALTLSGDARIDGAAKPTTFKADGSVSRIIDGAGAVSLRSATVHLTAEANDVPIESPDVSGHMNRLTATIVSEDLTRKIEVAAQGDGTINGNQQSEFSANLALAEPFEPNGAFTFAIENLTGSASGTRVPPSLAQPALTAAGIDALRDLGPTVDVEAFFPGGIGGDLMLEAKAPKASAELVARINADQSIAGSKLALNVPAADPALISALTGGGVFSDRPVGVSITLTSFAVPAPDAATAVRPLARFAATGALAITGPANVRPDHAAGTTATAPAAEPPLVPLERVRIDFDTPGLAQHVALKGDGSIGGGRITIDERLTNMFDASGALAMAGVKPQGTVRIENLPVETILAFAPAEQADTIREVIGKALSAEVATSVVDAGLKTELTARTDAVNAVISMVGRDDAAKSVQFDKTLIDATVSPRLAAIVQRDATSPVVLGSPAKVHVDLKPVLLPMGAAADMLSTPLSGKVTLRDAIIEKAPGIADTLAVPTLDAELTIVRKGSVMTAEITDGRATIKRGAAKHSVAQVGVSGSIAIDSTGGATVIRPNMDVQLADLSTRQAEALLGMEAGAIANWTGDSGSLDVHVESIEGGYLARATPGMPNVQGTFAVSMRDELIAITAETSRLILGKDVLQTRLNPPPADASAQSGSAPPTAPPTERAMLTVERDVPMQVAIRKLEFPLSMVRSQPFDAAKVNIDLALAGGPLLTTSADGVKSTISDLDMTIRAADLQKGLQFALKGVAEAIVPENYLPPDRPDAPPAATAPADQPEDEAAMEGMTPEQRREARREARARERAAAASRPAAEPASQPAPAEAASQPASQPQPKPPAPGKLDVTGVLAGVINSEGILDIAGGTLQMNALAENVPTAVADALGDMQGMLVAAVGPQMNATFVADNFSRNSGTLDSKITTTNGSLSGILRGREQSFRVNRNAPVVAELKLTTQLRDRLLMKIHPILADIRTTEQPLRVTIPTALAAMPADVSKLRADVEITVGKVELDSGSTTLKLLSLFGRSDRVTIPGEIEPIVAKIHNGVVTYDKFAVHIDRLTLNYSGQIDLVKQEVNLRTEIPLNALGQKIEQLQGFADAIAVPLVTRGKFGALKTSIDPDFDIGKAALNAGFKGTLGNILGGDGKGGLLDELFNRDKSQQPDAIANPPASERPRRRDRPTSQPAGQP